MRRNLLAKARTAMDTISMETFTENIAQLSSDPKKAGNFWYIWAQELADMDRPDTGVPGQPPEYFLAWIWREFQQVADNYGNTAAESVADLALRPHCLFPWEVYRAGEEFSLGRSADEVIGLSLAGMLDKPQEQNEGSLDLLT